MQLLQQEAVELPLAFGLLVVQQWTVLTGSPTHPGPGDTSGGDKSVLPFSCRYDAFKS